MISSLNLYLFKYLYNLSGKFNIIRLFSFGLGTSSTFMLFLFLPFDIIKSQTIISLISKFTSYTGGVYYLHVKVSKIILRKKFFRKNSFLSCVINYIICSIFCSLGFKIFKKTKLKYLFI